MNKKGMMPMGMHSLLMSLEAIKCLCTHEKAKLEFYEKASHKGKKGKKHPGTQSKARVPKKVCLRSIATCARSMGVHIPCTTLVIVVGLRKMERRNLISAPLRKAVRKRIQ
jgi:hypothetical protein